jgi:hypothetical protein
MDLKGSFSHVIEAVHNGKAKWVTDHSVDRTRSPNIFSAGWIIFCPDTQSFLRGSFYEVSPDASAYRGKLLGLTALHLIALAIKIHFTLDGPFGTIHCDNEHALGKARIYRCRIPSGSRHADLLGLLCSLKHSLHSTFTYYHIYSHANNKKLWHQLTLIEKLNIL